MTAEEQPAAPSPFPNSGPDLLFQVSLDDQAGTVSEVVRDAFLWLHDPAGVDTHPNLDLDADRGWRHVCWTVADGGSIRDIPISVSILPFGSE